jgi:hypothetical protein
MSKNGSQRNFIDSVEVKDPCSENWEEMTGNDKVRFCSHCSKDVNNLSEMTRKEARRLVRASGGNLCIRYIPHPVTRRPMFAEQLLQITRRTPRLTAGVMSASLSLSTMAYAQDSSALPDPGIVAERQLDEVQTEDTAAARPTRLRGTVTDPAGAVIPNAKVTITSVEAGASLATTTNDGGEYEFMEVKPGRYMIETESPGFSNNIREVTIAERTDTVADASMQIGFEISVDVTMDVPSFESGMGGVVVSVSYSTPLASAVADEDVDRVRELIAQGENVNGKDEAYDDITPLFVAVETGDLEIVQLLLDAGAKVNARSSNKRTPLMQIDSDATPELVDLLVRNGAKLNLTDKENNTALIAAINNWAPAAAVQALIRAGSDARVANKSGRTALMEAAERDDLDIVKLLVEVGADVNAKDDEGETAYDMTGDEEIEQYLIGHGAIVDPD